MLFCPGCAKLSTKYRQGFESERRKGEEPGGGRLDQPILHSNPGLVLPELSRLYVSIFNDRKKRKRASRYNTYCFIRATHPAQPPFIIRSQEEAFMIVRTMVFLEGELVWRGSSSASIQTNDKHWALYVYLFLLNDERNMEVCSCPQMVFSR